jgi:hypothetical protein
MRIKQLLFIILLTITSYAFAGQERGGGNTINGQLIETYVVNPKKALPDFQESMYTFIASLRSEFPNLALNLEITIRERTWYLVPVSLDKLPSELTGLQFLSQQTAYQNGQEIFFSSNQLKKMTKENRNLLYQHEILMAAFQLTSTQTRALMNVIIQNPHDYKFLLRDQISLATNGRYFYYTALEKNTLNEMVAYLNKFVFYICNRSSNTWDKADMLTDLITNERNAYRQNFNDKFIDLMRAESLQGSSVEILLNKLMDDVNASQGWSKGKERFTMDYTFSYCADKMSLR